MTRAVLIPRVSGGGQDELGQEPELVAYATQHEYDIVHIERIHAKSATKGMHEPQLRECIRMVAGNLADVLILTEVDRFDRRGIRSTLNLVHDTITAGGRVEFSSMPELNGKPYDEIESVISEEADDAKKEGVRRERRKDRGYKTVRRNEGAVGYPKYGYQIAGPKRAKRWDVHPERAMVVKGIFERVADNDSLRSIADWCLSVDPSMAWSPEHVRSIIGTQRLDSTCYYTGVVNTSIKGEPYSFPVEPLVSEDLYRKATAAIAKPRDIAKPTLSRFNRIFYCAHGNLLKRGAKHARTGYRYWYTKTGHGNEHACKCSYRDDRVSHMAHNALLKDSRELFNETLINAEDTRAERKAILDSELASLSARFKGDIDGMIARASEIKAELAGIAAEPKPRGSIERVSTGRTLGQLYTELTEAGADETAINDVLRQHNVRITLMDEESIMINAGMTLD